MSWKNGTVVIIIWARIVIAIERKRNLLGFKNRDPRINRARNTWAITSRLKTIVRANTSS